MKTKFGMDYIFIIAEIEKNYCLEVDEINFLPKGDSSYAYVVTCKDCKKYFLKLFDKSTGKGKESIALINFYLPLTWNMYQGGVYKNITYPIKNSKNNFQVDVGSAIFVLFNFIEGETLDDAYPFSKFLLEKVAKAIAEVHKVECQSFLKNAEKYAKVEDFEIHFEEDLLKALNELEVALKFEDKQLQALKEYIVPRKHKVLSFLSQLHIYQTAAKRNTNQMVITHGDIWGGNLMLDRNQNLHLIDWESAMIAPPEADLRHYLFEDFDYFIERYKEQLGMPIKLDSDVLGFYIYRSHLSNLTNWMCRMLDNNQSSEQNESDFECITFHCMDRWDGAAEKMKTLHNMLSNY